MRKLKNRGALKHNTYLVLYNGEQDGSFTRVKT
jgi:ribosomal protein L19E